MGDFEVAIRVQNDMDKIEDITGAIFQNKSEILGQLTLGLVKKNHSDLIESGILQLPAVQQTTESLEQKGKAKH